MYTMYGVRQVELSDDHFAIHKKRAYEIFESSEDEEKRQFLTFMLQNSVLNGRKLDLTLREPFQDLLHANESKTWLPLIDMFRTRQIDVTLDNYKFIERFMVLY